MDKKSFFEYLGIAGVERVHSQILAWLFSEDCQALSDGQKNKLLKNIFKLQTESSIKNIRTEYGKIDILIETETDIVIIENKIKSSQHSNQLQKYEAFCEENFKDKNKYYCYLSLVEESINSGNWQKISYQEIFDNINLLQIDYTTSHGIILQEYIIFLSRLTQVVRDFNANTKEYAMVFIDGSKTKEDKRNFTYKNINEEFIAKNQLETILQKGFLYRLMDKVNPHAIIGETRGTALINFYIKSSIQLGERNGFETYIQLQGNTIKFVFAMNGYELDKSNKDWVKDAIIQMKYLSTVNTFGYNKCNEPDKKAYVSISKKVQIPYWKQEEDKLIEYINIEIENGTKLTHNLLNLLNIND